MPEDVYGFDRARAERLKAIADHPKIINSLRLPRKRQPTGGGQQSFYKAAEDIAPSRDWFYANPCSRSGTVTDSTEFTKVYHWESLLDHMRAGYVMLTASVDGEIVFNQGPCISTLAPRVVLLSLLMRLRRALSARRTLIRFRLEGYRVQRPQFRCLQA